MIEGQSNRQGRFCTTQWTMVLDARADDSAQAFAALEKLCQTYWYPLYSFVRRKGHSPEDAQDLVQGFFEALLRKDYLKAVDRGKGKFRTFLLASMTHYLANEWDKRNRLKRGGGCAVISIDGVEAEERFALEPAAAGNPSLAFERSWAETLVETVLEGLAEEYSMAGEAGRFEALKATLMGDGELRYKDFGAALGLSEGGVKTAVRRMRIRFRELLLRELAQTLAEGEDGEDELRHLLQALAHPG